MKIRRVVTGHSPSGRAVVASDTVLEGVRPPLLPGVELHQLWGADETMSYPDDGSSPPCPTWFPPVGGFRFLHFVLPPDAQAQEPLRGDAEAARTETDRQTPGLMDTMDAERPGMHRSDTIDLVYVVSGRALCELDDGVQIRLFAGDTLIQSGTRHRWSNPHTESCLIVGVLVGARRRSGDSGGSRVMHRDPARTRSSPTR